MNLEIKIIRKVKCSICETEVEVKRDTWTKDLMCDQCTLSWYRRYKQK